MQFASRVVACSLFLTASMAWSQNIDQRPGPGQDLYEAQCASCHEGSPSATQRAPSRAAISGMSARAIVDALENGKMREQGAALSEEQRRLVAEWWAGAPLAPVVLPASAFCNVPPAPEGEIAWSGWGGDLQGTGFRSHEQAGLAAAEVPELELKWAFGFPGAIQVRSKPAIVGDLLMIGSATGEVYALDSRSGCIHWVFRADAAVRSAVVLGRAPAGRLAAYFSDFRTNIYALDVRDGSLLWRTVAGSHVDASNTGSVVYHDGRLYVPLSSMEGLQARNPEYECCTSSGEVVALDAANGEILWRHRVVAEPALHVGENALGARSFGPSGAPVWSSPTVDARRGLLYLGTGENYSRPASATSDAVLALHLASGETAWRFQATADDTWNLACGFTTPENCPDPMGPDVDFGMAPLLLQRGDGREVLVVGQKSGVVFALDPDDRGAVLWQTRMGKGSALGGVHWGLASDGQRVFVPISDTPTGMLGIEPDVPPNPGVFALQLDNGEVAWRQPAPPDACAGKADCVAANSAAPTAIPGAVFAGGLDGVLRAYSTTDGQVLWAFDTARAFTTVNGVAARGGAIDGPGPVIANGMLYSQSGYGMFGQMPGNVLLAFGKKAP